MKDQNVTDNGLYNVVFNLINIPGISSSISLLPESDPDGGIIADYIQKLWCLQPSREASESLLLKDPDGLHT